MKNQSKKTFTVLCAIFLVISTMLSLAVYAEETTAQEETTVQEEASTEVVVCTHEWDTGNITESPTCAKAGVKTYTCTSCGETKTEAVAKTAHTWSKKVTKKATCTKDGVKTYTCTTCGKVTTKAIAKTGHKYATKVVKKATTKENGKYTTNVCKVCGKKSSKSETKTTYKVSTIKLAKTKYTYNGKVQKPTVVVKNSKGKALSKTASYTVKYSNAKSKAPGTYKVTVTLKGKYSGKKVLTYKINPKATTTTVKNVTKKMTVKQIVSGDNYQNMKTKDVVRNVGKGLKISWKKVTGASGYQIQYSTSKDFKNAKTVKVTGNKTFTYTLKKVSAKTYYVRVRAYKYTKAYKSYAYAKWSKVISIKAKYSCGGNSKHFCLNKSEHERLTEWETTECSLCGKKYCSRSYMIGKYGNVGAFQDFCSKYSPKTDPTKYCQDCGKPIGCGKGHCIQLCYDTTCPHCGKFCKEWTCHECLGDPNCWDY